MGIPVDARDRNGMTAFLEASRQRRYALARKLLELGANPLATNGIGENALHLLSYHLPKFHSIDEVKATREYVRDLISRGLNRQQKDRAGMTPGEWARDREELARGISVYNPNEERLSRILAAP